MKIVRVTKQSPMGELSLRFHVTEGMISATIENQAGDNAIVSVRQTSVTTSLSYSEPSPVQRSLVEWFLANHVKQDWLGNNRIVGFEKELGK